MSYLNFYIYVCLQAIIIQAQTAQDYADFLAKYKSGPRPKTKSTVSINTENESMQKLLAAMGPAKAKDFLEKFRGKFGQKGLHGHGTADSNSYLKPNNRTNVLIVGEYRGGANLVG